MIVWGGGYLGSVIATDTGARYNPQADTWTAISTTGAPSPRFHRVVVWAGTEMIVWGGSQNRVEGMPVLVKLLLSFQQQARCPETASVFPT